MCPYQATAGLCQRFSDPKGRIHGRAANRIESVIGASGRSVILPVFVVSEQRQMPTMRFLRCQNVKIDGEAAREPRLANEP